MTVTNRMILSIQSTDATCKGIKRIPVLFSLVLCLFLLCSGCGDRARPTDESQPATGPVIAITYLDGKNDYFPTLAKTICDLAEANGYKTIVRDACRDNERQTQQMLDFIKDGVSAIVLVPCDSSGIGEAVLRANEAGVPIFTADAAVNNPLAKVVCHVATDNYQGGKNAAEQLVAALGRKGKVAVLDDPNIESTQLRTRGFREVVTYANRLGAEIEIVAVKPGYGSENESRLTMLEILDDHPDLSGVFAINAPTCRGVLAAIRARHREGKIKIVSFDGNKEIKKLVDEGIVLADIIQLPDEIGRLTFEYVDRYLHGKMIVSQTLFTAPAYVKKR